MVGKVNLEIKFALTKMNLEDFLSTTGIPTRCKDPIIDQTLKANDPQVHDPTLQGHIPRPHSAIGMRDVGVEEENIQISRSSPVPSDELVKLTKGQLPMMEVKEGVVGSPRVHMPAVEKDITEEGGVVEEDANETGLGSRHVESGESDVGVNGLQGDDIKEKELVEDAQEVIGDGGKSGPEITESEIVNEKEESKVKQKGQSVVEEVGEHPDDAVSQSSGKSRKVRFADQVEQVHLELEVKDEVKNESVQGDINNGVDNVEFFITEDGKADIDEVKLVEKIGDGDSGDNVTDMEKAGELDQGGHLLRTDDEKIEGKVDEPDNIFSSEEGVEYNSEESEDYNSTVIKVNISPKNEMVEEVAEN